MVEFSQSGQEKIKRRLRLEKKTDTIKMKFTGTLIEDLMATVERVEERSQSDGSVVEPMLVESMLVEPMLVEPMLASPWLVSSQNNTDYESKFLGVA